MKVWKRISFGLAATTLRTNIRLNSVFEYNEKCENWTKSKSMSGLVENILCITNVCHWFALLGARDHWECYIEICKHELCERVNAPINVISTFTSNTKRSSDSRASLQCDGFFSADEWMLAFLALFTQEFLSFELGVSGQWDWIWFLGQRRTGC